ncbi:MAG: 16S rRNA (adenine(1518)-N(6)/adenine(1519)-N(6))-dimethyltransferase RsmA [Synechococcaceae cyanobacterium]|nr:16S rRNA (adenine(1518)-N(6)/adenine(1519)-N(6))-dimethyltransferase RsmA [Synechococcaceae cyanobacterium]
MTFEGHRARKRFGQHWLVDEGILDRIITAAELTPADQVLEIGPGRGALTRRLLDSPLRRLDAIELDRDLVAGLAQRFGADPRFHLIEADVLSAELPEGDPGHPAKVVANIPYNITGPLLQRLLGRLDAPPPRRYSRLVLLVQREIGERIRALPGSSAYSALSVRMQLLCRAAQVCDVPPRCFAPPPRVMSEVIVLEPLPAAERPPLALAARLERLLRHVFSARRKMLRNSLAGLPGAGEPETFAARLGLDLSRRPQELAPAEWLDLARELAG